LALKLVWLLGLHVSWGVSYKQEQNPLESSRKSFSKCEFFSFLHLCLDFCIRCKTNVIKGWLFLDFDNAFAFALYSRMFPPFAKYAPCSVFLNGGYNFNLKGFLSEFTTLSHPFFQCSLIRIFKFFLQWQ
jgi:hypothetical protein